METLAPFARPAYVMLKPVGARCNLACNYCYYLEKEKLYADGRDQLLPFDLLERFTRDYIALQTQSDVLFTWHGGEPLLRPSAFYQRALAFQRKYAGDHRIDNALQTNGTLLTDDWARFFRDNNFLIGVSIDGTEQQHDRYRHTRGGGPTHKQVMRGIEILERHGVQWNALATVNHFNADEPLAFYDFFRSIGCHFLQFTPVVERLETQTDGRYLASPLAGASARLAPFSVSPQQWGRFLIGVFDRWIKTDVGSTFVQLFDATLAGWCGVPPGVCTLAETCGAAAAMEWNGDVFVCDHYVFPEYRLGNVRTTPLPEMLYGEAATRFGQEKKTTLTQQCRECPWLMACHGECPRLRFATDRYGNAGHHYLCAGYEAYFAHVAPYMDAMKSLLQEGRPPAEVMQQTIG